MSTNQKLSSSEYFTVILAPVASLIRTICLRNSGP